MHPIRPGKALSILTTALGLTVLLAACGGNPTSSDTSNPTVEMTSAANSATAAYTLTGLAVDNVAVTGVNYTLNGGTALAASVTGNSFTANLTLGAGPNSIQVTSSDAAGNIGTDSLTVTYDAPPAGAATSVDIAARGDLVTSA